jgi:hypothetical protein
MSNKLKKIKDLSQDPVLLDLRHVNEQIVSRYRQAMRVGDQFPPLMVDTQNVIISGNHRYQAYIEEFGEDHKVACIVCDIKDPADRIETATRENINHGYPLDGISKKRIIGSLVALGRSKEHISKLLGMPINRITKLGDEVVFIRGANGGKKSAPIKRGLEHLKGKTVTQSKYDEHIVSDRGLPAAMIAKQLTRWIANGWVNLEDAKTVESLQGLKAALNSLDL